MSTNPSRNEALESVAKVLSSLQQNSGDSLSESERVAALAEATKLVAALEKPEDASLKFAYMVSLVTRISQNTECVLLTLNLAARSLDGHQNTG